MAGDLNSKNGNYNQKQHFFDVSGQICVLASCYSVQASSEVVKGFHYCTTNGAGKTFYFDHWGFSIWRFMRR